ncbi:hypothetical protein C7444_11255 [Sphaerotilus hippei]|uniref:Uncharacterized protein n=1 Tax=Sphaerotilus hippei TaxID=744406 RepID=A0A318GY10_9BURK|nr:hypothetical protein [Sphaerotilus hippei]PXW94740.1 hypothetical protein C7444_11255 [Sphaerotilus hippei]
MFQAIHRLLRPRAVAAPDSGLLEEWAEHRGEHCKRVRRGHGCAIDFRVLGRPGRMEWGPSQRDYIPRQELRVRIDMGLPALLEMMVMSRPLAERLEGDAYGTLVQGHKTGMGHALPEELRWLSMMDRVDFPDHELLAQRFVLMAASAPHAARWVRGDLANRLMRAATRWLSPEAPLVLMTLRGRLYLRTEANQLEMAMLDGARSLAEVAATRAQACLQARVPAEPAEPGMPAAALVPQVAAPAFSRLAPMASDDDELSDLTLRHADTDVRL